MCVNVYMCRGFNGAIVFEREMMPSREFFRACRCGVFCESLWCDDERIV